MDLPTLLPLLFGIIIATGIALYVALDGFDLGVGILFPFARSDDDRSTMMNSIAPFWDGNETWLVLGGGGLLAAFPLAYATLLPALYIPIMVMLFALIFRGVAFEFRFKAERTRKYWDIAFAGGSMLAAFAQGVVLGAFIDGFEFTADGRVVGGALNWLDGFPLLCGFGLMAGYAMLGATWLVLKTEGGLQDQAYRWARRLLFVLLGMIGVVSLWTPSAFPEIRDRWFSLPNFWFLWPVPFVTAIVAWRLWRALAARQELAPFLYTLALFLLSFLGLGVSMWPYVVPRVYTLWDAAAAPNALTLILIGVVIMLPVVLAYTAFNYWIFRGKVRAGKAGGYHG